MRIGLSTVLTGPREKGKVREGTAVFGLGFSSRCSQPWEDPGDNCLGHHWGGGRGADGRAWGWLSLFPRILCFLWS